MTFNADYCMPKSSGERRKRVTYAGETTWSAKVTCRCDLTLYGHKGKSSNSSSFQHNRAKRIINEVKIT